MDSSWRVIKTFDQVPEQQIGDARLFAVNTAASEERFVGRSLCRVTAYLGTTSRTNRNLFGANDATEVSNSETAKASYAPLTSSGLADRCDLA